MAKKTKKTVDEMEEKALQEEAPEGFEEIGDHWDEMKVVNESFPEIEGTYLGTATEVGENESQVHVLLVDGVRIGVWGSTLLDNRMKACDEGNYVMIRFTGVETSNKRGREYRNYKVFRRTKK